MKTANNSRIVKKANSYLLLSTIRQYEPLTIEEMIHKTRLSRPTVLNLLSDLRERNIIEKSGFREASSGRQPTLYSLNLKSNFAVGVDFEFPPIRVTIANIKGDTVFSRLWYQEYGDSEDLVVSKIEDAILEGLSKLQINESHLIGIALGMPGIVNIKKNTAVRMPRMPSTKLFNIDQKLEFRFGVPIFVRNDAHLLAITDKENMTKTDGSMLYIAYRTGIGMAVIENGTLSEGNYGNSGYIGHTTIDVSGEKCSCGQNGCLEMFCSKRAIVNRYNNHPSALKQIKSFSELAALSNEKKDPTAIQVLQEAGTSFAIAIANAVKLFDIPVVVIGDLDCGEENVFFKTIRDVVAENTAVHSIVPVRVVYGKSDECDYALGGCMFVIEQFFKAPKLTLKI